MNTLATLTARYSAGWSVDLSGTGATYEGEDIREAERAIEDTLGFRGTLPGRLPELSILVFQRRML